jgi:hypothetical protein
VKLWPVDPSFDDGGGLGFDVRWFGHSTSGRSGKESRYLWTLAMEGLRYSPSAGGDDLGAVSFLVSTGMMLAPNTPIYLRVGLGFSVCEDAAGTRHAGMSTDLALGAMVPAGSIDVCVEARSIWTKPGADVLDATAAVLGVFYCW